MIFSMILIRQGFGKRLYVFLWIEMVENINDQWSVSWTRNSEWTAPVLTNKEL